MLGLEGFIILIIIAVGIVIANYVVNRGGKKDRENDPPKE